MLKLSYIFYIVKYGTVYNLDCVKISFYLFIE